MKILIISSLMVVMAFCGLHGCASMNCNEFTEHGSIWKSWDHAYFSYYGYRNPTPDAIKKSVEEGWWGCSVEVDK